MALPATDNFTAPNGTLLTVYSPNWTACSYNFKINTNSVYTDDFHECGAGWNADAFAANQYSQARVVAISDAMEANLIGVSARDDIATPSANYYCFYGDAAFSYLAKVIAGVYTQLGDDGPGFELDDIIRIEAEGTTITAKINGVVVLSETDAALSSGAAGLSGWGSSTLCRVDDWEGGNLGGPPPPPIPPPGILPGYELGLMRSHPQMSDMYLVIQQPQRFTEAPYLAQREWVDYDWYCRVNGDQTAEIAESISVNNGGPVITLLDGMTVLIGSAYGEWDKLAVRLRTDQAVGPGTTTLYIATSSDVRGHVRNGDYIVVLDEFRLWQRFGRIESIAGAINWYKDHDIEWTDLGANDVARRLAMMPPIPMMGPHAVKFVSPSEGDGHSSQFYFDWSDSYAMAVGETISSWNSWGERNHTGGTWTSAVEIPGWQTTQFISGLRGFRVVLEVDDDNGNAATLPYRRGVRYVFTLRRPGQRQEYDPENAEPITDFAVNGAIQGSFEAGHWRTSITVFGDAASKYNIMPEALVILFTDDHYMADDPYLAPRGLRNVSIGPIYDRENILLVGRIIGSSIQIDSETEDVTFDILSPGAEAEMYHDYPIVIQDGALSTDWINTPSLTPDRAVWYYLCWHTTLPHTCDLYLPGDTHPIFAQDFLEGTIQDTADSFLRDRIMGRMLCDKYGRIHCEVNAQDQPYGSIETLWLLDDGDWVDNLRVRQALQARIKSAEAGGIIYTPATGVIVPKLSRAPGQFDKYRGSAQASNSLAINSQNELNIISGRFLEHLNYEYNVDISLAGFWPYLDIAPQYAIYIQKSLHRGELNSRFLPRTITFSPRHDAGTIFTDVEVEQEMDDGVSGVTIPIPDELPDLEPPEYGLPTTPTFPAGFGGIVPIGPVPGEPIDLTDLGQWYAVQYSNATHYYDEAHGPKGHPASGSWDPVAADASIYKTCMMYSTTTNRFFGYGYGIWEYSPLPLGTGAWAQKYTELQIATLLDHAADYVEVYLFRMQFSIRPSQEGWGWAAGTMWYVDGGGDDHLVLFCLHTRNGWGGVVYATEIFDYEEDVDFDTFITIGTEGSLALDMHSNTVYIVIAKEPEADIGDMPTYDGWWHLYRSQDFGQTFALAQSENFVWGIDGYPFRSNPYEIQCDVWVPWKSNTYQGGTVFWTAACLQETELGMEWQIISLIYRSQNHGLSYEDLGDDGGDLQSGLNFLGGPYNSLDRVYGGVSLWRGEDDDMLRTYTWRSGYGWTQFRRTTLAGGFNDAQVWVILGQEGYALEDALAYMQPWYITADIDVNVGPGVRIFWLTYVPPG